LAHFLKASTGKAGIPMIPIPRATIPRWVKRAVFFRDAGHCALVTVHVV